MTGAGDDDKGKVRSPFTGMAPPGLTPRPPAAGPPPQPPRVHLLEENRPRPKGWRRWLRWLGLPALGATALVIPRPAMAPAISHAMPVTPKASDGRAEDPVLKTLQQIDQKAAALPAGQSPFQAITARLADKAADLALELCLIAAAKGAWHLAADVWAKRRARTPEGLPQGVLYKPAPELGDQGEAELESLERWIDTQDRAALEAPEMPEDGTMRAIGGRMLERMRTELQAAICAEKGLPRKLAGDTVKEVAEHLRKALGRQEPGTALSLVLAGLAAAVAKLGLDRFCDPKAKALP